MEQDAQLVVQRGRGREFGLRLVSSLVVRQHHETIIMWCRAECSAGKSTNDQRRWVEYMRSLLQGLRRILLLHAAPSMLDEAEASTKAIG